MISADSQKLVPGNYIVLFQLDLRRFGGPVYYFSPTAYTDRVVRWRDINDPPGITDYTPWQIKGEGFETSGQGTLPRPKLTIGNVNKALASVVRQYKGFQGATIYRYRTLKHYLVGEARESLDDHYPVDVYRIERKANQNKLFIEWELRTLLDCEGEKIPMRQIVRDSCGHVYRHFVGAATFDYTYATCRYAEPYYFDALGNPTTADKDVCGKNLPSCRLRFPGNVSLPFAGFPGVGKANTR